MPIIPDEARTFGMDPLFKEVGIYSALGQRYDPVDSNLVLSYREATDGQVLEEGITEAGSTASLPGGGHVVRDARRADDPVLHLLFDVRLPAHRRRALGVRRRARPRLPARRHGRPHDAQRRGPPARGRPQPRARLALSPPRASTTRPSRTRPRPSSATACARMYGDAARGRLLLPRALQREPRHAAAAGGVTDEDIVRGLYRFRAAPELPQGRAARDDPGVRARSCSRPSRAQELLAERFGVAPTSRAPPRSSCCATRRWRSSTGTCSTPASASRPPRQRAARRACGRGSGRGRVRLDPGLARHDLALGARRAPGVSLGTDGFGRSDTREALRRFFDIDAAHIAAAVLSELARCGQVPADTAARRHRGARHRHRGAVRAASLTVRHPTGVGPGTRLGVSSCACLPDQRSSRRSRSRSCSRERPLPWRHRIRPRAIGPARSPSSSSRSRRGFESPRVPDPGRDRRWTAVRGRAGRRRARRVPRRDRRRGAVPRPAGPHQRRRRGGPARARVPSRLRGRTAGCSCTTAPRAAAPSSSPSCMRSMVSWTQRRSGSCCAWLTSRATTTGACSRSTRTGCCSSAPAMAAVAATRSATARTTPSPWASCCASTWTAATRTASPSMTPKGSLRRGRRCPRSVATGLRNPWRFSVDRATGDCVHRRCGPGRLGGGRRPAGRSGRLGLRLVGHGGTRPASRRRPATRPASRSGRQPTRACPRATAAPSSAATSIAERPSRP